MQQKVIVTAIKPSKGEFEGKEFDSLVFHIESEIASNGSGEGFGQVSTPNKLGKSADIERWLKYKPAPGQIMRLPCVAEYVIQGDGKGGQKLTLVALNPEPQAKAA
jgi:hypothetical protein